MRFRADGTGKVAIYQPGTGGSDDVFDDPLVDLDRVVFHTNFPFLGIVKRLTGTLNVPEGNPAFILGAHEQVGTPAYIGFIHSCPASARTIPWSGNVPVKQQAPYPAPESGIVTWGLLSADDTNIHAHFNSFGGFCPVRYEILILSVTVV